MLGYQATLLAPAGEELTIEDHVDHLLQRVPACIFSLVQIVEDHGSEYLRKAKGSTPVH
jgi:hypothetical protein